ncbi:MAG TPA: flap endonuclease-1 [Candidatus Nanoarchaeia archaeon]|nr:flap endonuclease-1 [Candidatus Nanoarchaeia archaeon]
MGVQLTDLVPKHEITFEELKNKKIAVDASQMLYQFLSSIRQPDGSPLCDNQGRTTSHLLGLSTRIPNLMAKELKLCFVFDGTPPKLKQQEIANRQERKQISRDKLAIAREEDDEEAISRYSKQSISVYKELIEESKEFISALGLPVIQSPSEAEAQASYLAEKKIVDYVASSDYDSLLYGCPGMIRNLTLASRRKLPSGQYVSITPELISLSETLNSLGITKEQLIYLAILVGTDFNPSGIKGIGPKTALKLVKENKKPEDIFSKYETDFDWKQVYNVFKKMPIEKKVSLVWKHPNQDKIRKILLDHDFNEARVEKLLESLEKETKKKSQSNLDTWF